MTVLTPPTPLASQRWSYADGVDIAVEEMEGVGRGIQEGKGGMEEGVREVKLTQSMPYQT